MHTRRDQIQHIGRLLKRADFLRVQKDGRKWVTPTCVVQIAAAPAESATPIRYGLTIPKKIWPRAVDRNRVRRRVRAVLLAVLADPTGPMMDQAEGLDVVVLPRAEALTAPSTTLDKDLRWAFKRLTTPKAAP